LVYSEFIAACHFLDTLAVSRSSQAGTPRLDCHVEGETHCKPV